MTTWFYILTVICCSPYLKDGHELVGSSAYYSEVTCNESARLVAQGLYIKEGTQYGYRCKRVEFEPPDLNK